MRTRGREGNVGRKREKRNERGKDGVLGYWCQEILICALTQSLKCSCQIVSEALQLEVILH